MTRDQVFQKTAERCRKLALRVRTDAARTSLLNIAQEFEARAEQEREQEREAETEDQLQAAD